MTYLDSAILNILERFCHWFQLLTGRTNVWLAAQLTNLSVIVYFVRIRAVARAISKRSTMRSPT